MDIILDKLFNSLEIRSLDDLSSLIDGMDASKAGTVLKMAVRASFERGSYSMLETEIISKALRTLEANENLRSGGEVGGA